MDAMNRLVAYALETGKLQFIPVLQVHDDLTFYLPEESWKSDLAYIARTMLTCPYDFAKLVPLAVEASAGPNWNSQKGVGTFSSDKMEEIIIS